MPTSHHKNVYKKILEKRKEIEEKEREGRREKEERKKKGVREKKEKRVQRKELPGSISLSKSPTSTFTLKHSIPPQSGNRGNTYVHQSNIKN